MAGWFYNSLTGSLNRVPTIAEGPYLLPGTGWHELRIPYTSTRQQAINAAKLEFPGGPTPGAPILQNIVPGGTAIGAIGDFFHRLTEGETWIRVGEVALGAILIYAGVRALSSGTQAATATKTVTTPAKKATRKTKNVAESVVVPEYKAARRVSHARKLAEQRARPAAPRVSHIYHHRAPAKPKTVSLTKKPKPKVKP